ncbi:MAG: sulfotransferase [Deltaproteobacteria bacterium]|nr:sulfotransferase [Deltaproteobacteria bacterium]
MLFHFDFAIWARMVSLALRERGARRAWYLYRLLIWVPVVASTHAVCFFLDALLFPRLRRIEVRSPVFLVGHARSGTTLLHRLMSQDGERFCSNRMIELYLPSLLQKKLLRALGAFDRRVLGRRLAKRVRAWEQRRYRATKDIHAMGLFKPEEDDLFFYYSCASGFWSTKVPYLGKIDFFAIDRWPEKRRRRLMRFYRECIKRQLYVDGADKIYTSKSPVFAGRVAALIEEFPDARFGITLRDPGETIPSLLKLLQTAYRLQGASPEDAKRALEAQVEISLESYLHPHEVLAKHPGTKRALVDYAQLTAAPRGALEKMYAELGFDVTPELARVLAAEEARAKKHETSHRYSLEEFGLAKNTLRERMAKLYAQFHWPRDEETK